MANNTDFLALYAELGLQGNYTFVDFRRAYRHRVAELHPDRVGSTATLAHLQQLNAQYAAVAEFWRRHGRMPGTVVPHAPPTPRGTRDPVGREGAPASRPSIHRRWTAWIAALVVASAIGWWQADSESESESAHVAVDAPVASGERETARVPMIEIGTSQSAVRAMQGPPITMNRNLWEYGPSWIRFRCHAVNDWYSSPLHPLQVATTTPPPPSDPPKHRVLPCLDPDPDA